MAGPLLHDRILDSGPVNREKIPFPESDICGNNARATIQWTRIFHRTRKSHKEVEMKVKALLAIGVVAQAGYGQGFFAKGIAKLAKSVGGL